MKLEHKQALADLIARLDDIELCLQRMSNEQLESLDEIAPDTADYDTVSYACNAASDAVSFIDNALIKILEVYGAI